MVNNRRSELEIIRDILELSQDGAKKTEILYRNNMSFNQLNSYLSYLLEKEIIIESYSSNNSNERLYFNTDKGNELLDDIVKVLSYLKK